MSTVENPTAAAPLVPDNKPATIAVTTPTAVRKRRPYFRAMAAFWLILGVVLAILAPILLYLVSHLAVPDLEAISWMRRVSRAHQCKRFMLGNDALDEHLDSPSRLLAAEQPRFHYARVVQHHDIGW